MTSPGWSKCVFEIVQTCLASPLGQKFKLGRGPKIVTVTSGPGFRTCWRLMRLSWSTHVSERTLLIWKVSRMKEGQNKTLFRSLFWRFLEKAKVWITSKERWYYRTSNQTRKGYHWIPNAGDQYEWYLVWDPYRIQYWTGYHVGTVEIFRSEWTVSRTCC